MKKTTLSIASFVLAVTMIFCVLPVISTAAPALYDNSKSTVVLVDSKLDLSIDEIAEEIGTTPVYYTIVNTRSDIADNIDMYGDNCEILLYVSNSNIRLQDSAKSLKIKAICK